MIWLSAGHSKSKCTLQSHDRHHILHIVMSVKPVKIESFQCQTMNSGKNSMENLILLSNVTWIHDLTEFRMGKVEWRLNGGTLEVRVLKGLHWVLYHNTVFFSRKVLDPRIQSCNTYRTFKHIWFWSWEKKIRDASWLLNPLCPPAPTAILKSWYNCIAHHHVTSSPFIDSWPFSFCEVETFVKH